MAGRKEPIIEFLSTTTPRWSTSSFGHGALNSSLDLSLLGEHLDHCRGAHDRLFTMQCLAETLHGFVAGRLVTTLVVATLLIGVASIVF